MDYIYRYQSPLGGITMASDGSGLTGLWFDRQQHFGSTLSTEHEEILLPVFEETSSWLDTYFSRKIPDFVPPLVLHAAPFRKAVWEILLTIPYGQTITYGEIAERIAVQTGSGNMSAQAIGGAVAHNPISLIIPCHRVIGAHNKLTGYAGGLDKKMYLLQMEQAVYKSHMINHTQLD